MKHRESRRSETIDFDQDPVEPDHPLYGFVLLGQHRTFTDSKVYVRVNRHGKKELFDWKRTRVVDGQEELASVRRDDVLLFPHIRAKIRRMGLLIAGAYPHIPEDAIRELKEFVKVEQARLRSIYEE